MPYLHLVFPLPFTYFFPLSVSKPPRYHLNTTSLPFNYHPVLSPYSPSLVLGEGPDDLVLWDALALIRQVSLASTRYTLPFPPPVFTDTLLSVLIREIRGNNKKNANALAYVQIFLYLCKRKG